uniref:Uncharacterized protein n=1 Tax=Euplotes harpa TaxID=151035 RepID=A0A7S3JJD9_9SPIT|mmetsp:Transcript_43381/g.51014  ORF Transcript_43381/g.51014 Transcript_43381/m.51014 type:complete len:142 (+) Transcript_43381:500-925(+)
MRFKDDPNKLNRSKEISALESHFKELHPKLSDSTKKKVLKINKSQISASTTGYKFTRKAEKSPEQSSHAELSPLPLKQLDVLLQDPENDPQELQKQKTELLALPVDAEYGDLMQIMESNRRRSVFDNDFYNDPHITIQDMK